ncbi:MAG: Bifunctional thiamine biosynthesis protein ThiDN [Methanoregulaceae archaeon PtaB.Bin152]|nr:MAG: Bifunctional thiamine biosynthesis protein ThiDN [Methanoregulaceae archaeon PtaB.Bin152]
MDDGTPDEDMISEERETEEDIAMRTLMYAALSHLESCREFARLIPEVRTNIVYARDTALSPKDVLAIDGRITVVGGMPRAAGKPGFGVSSHMARLLLELRKRDPSIRAGINFANDPALASWLEEYARKKGWVFSVIDRSREPEAIKGAEGASMPWKVGEAIRTAGGRVPKVFYETGAVGKEPVSVLVGSDPGTVVDEVVTIARLFVRGQQG